MIYNIIQEKAHFTIIFSQIVCQRKDIFNALNFSLKKFLAGPSYRSSIIRKRIQVINAVSAVFKRV